MIIATITLGLNSLFAEQLLERRRSELETATATVGEEGPNSGLVI